MYSHSIRWYKLKTLVTIFVYYNSSNLTELSEHPHYVGHTIFFCAGTCLEVGALKTKTKLLKM